MRGGQILAKNIENNIKGVIKLKTNKSGFMNSLSSVVTILFLLKNIILLFFIVFYRVEN